MTEKTISAQEWKRFVIKYNFFSLTGRKICRIEDERGHILFIGNESLFFNSFSIIDLNGKVIAKIKASWFNHYKIYFNNELVAYGDWGISNLPSRIFWKFIAYNYKVKILDQDFHIRKQRLFSGYWSIIRNEQEIVKFKKKCNSVYVDIKNDEDETLLLPIIIANLTCSFNS